jgi:hypothetical protein
VLKFEWNALRSGHKVLVHDPGSAEMALTAGVVAVFETHKGANGVGIRLPVKGGEDVVLWPSRLVVHPDPRDATEPCWRCDELADRAGQRPDTPRQKAQRPTSMALRREVTARGTGAVEAAVT